jgi:hypothetical protein
MQILLKIRDGRLLIEFKYLIMKKYKILILPLMAIILFVAGCIDYETMGEFDVDEALVPGARTDVPLKPSAFVASYDDYCDQVVLSWKPVVRASSYDLYKDGTLLASDLLDTTYTDFDALPIDVEYWVVSKNANGVSEDSASDIGRMAAVPTTPSNFVATDGDYESKVELSWDAADYAKYYEVWRGAEVLSDSVVGTIFSDLDGPQVSTEYSLIAHSYCGQSAAVTAFGRADSMKKYDIIIDKNFDGLAVGLDLRTDPMLFARFNYDAAGGPGTFLVSTVDAVSGTKCAEAKLNNPTASAAKSTQVIISNINLLVGQRYRISFKIKTAAATSLHIAVDVNESGIPDKADGIDAYLMPTAVNSSNGNLFGLKLSSSSEWKTVSYEFPMTGTGLNQDDVDPAVAGWTATTIQAGQEHPVIMIAQWVGAHVVGPSILLDDLKIERIK